MQLSAEEQIRKRCRVRKEYYDNMHSYQHAIEKKDATIQKQNDLITQKNTEIAQMK